MMSFTEDRSHLKEVLVYSTLPLALEHGRSAPDGPVNIDVQGAC